MRESVSLRCLLMCSNVCVRSIIIYQVLAVVCEYNIYRYVSTHMTLCNKQVCGCVVAIDCLLLTTAVLDHVYIGTGTYGGGAYNYYGRGGRGC